MNAPRQSVRYARQWVKNVEANLTRSPGLKAGRPNREAWRRSVQDRALDDLKQQVKAHHFQIFFLHFIKEQPMKTVARALVRTWRSSIW